MAGLISNLVQRESLERFLRDRLSEPLHLNLLSLPIALFGSTRSKIYFDLCARPQHAYGLLAAADRARALGYDRSTVIEFGVGSGAGLLNLCELGERVASETGIGFDIVGFDTGSGMPDALDYRDHPEFYELRSLSLQAPERLRAALPKNAELIIGPLRATVSEFDPRSPIGFVSMDVNYYSCARDCLNVFTRAAHKYQPVVDVYLDDIAAAGHNEWCGELRAVREFSDAHETRRIARTNFLREQRLFKNASWISQFYSLYVLDHPARSSAFAAAQPTVANPSLRLAL